MVRAKLHIICGNCGCNDDFKYEIEKTYDEDDNEVNEIAITCENCLTIHWLYPEGGE